MRGKREREERVSREQKFTMLAFMEEHGDFARGKLLGTGMGGRRAWQSLWDELTNSLNNVEGPIKNSNKWQRVWTDIKNKAKKKASAIGRCRDRTGGGSALKMVLTNFEERCLALLTEEAVFGLEGPDWISLDSEELQPGPSHLPLPEPSSQPRSGPSNLPQPEPAVDEAIYICESEESLLLSASSTEETEEVLNPPKRRKTSRSSKMYETLNLNTSMKEINTTLKDILEERKTTNALLSRIADSLEKTANK